MKKIFSVLLLPLLLSSCASTFFYSKITSPDENIFQTENGDFIVDSDSLLVAYWFNGENTPISINVYNKSSTPLYINWAQSFLMKADSSIYPYKGQFRSIDLEFDHVIENIVEKDGETITYRKDLGKLPTDVSYIPPSSRITFKSNVLSNFEYKKFKESFFKESTILNDEKIKNKNGEIRNVKTVDFSSKNSPLSFTSFLVLYNRPERSFLVENNFYISNLIKTEKLSPYDLPSTFVDRGDITYIEKESKNKQFGQGVLCTSLVALIVVAVINGDPNNLEDDDDYDY